MIGQTLKGRYRIDAKIGHGAMGQVFRAADLSTGDVVAVKQMSKELAGDEDQRKRFQREAAALRKLRHPHIMGYIDAFSLEGQDFLVLEFYGGGTLSAIIKNNTPMPTDLFKGLIVPILDAVASAHRVGVVHRDLKPDNILLSVNQEPKVADFGLARVAEMSTLTQSGTMLGTLAYMPPEAFDPFIRQDQRGDIWALGVIMFEMLTGGLPFRGRTQMELMAAIAADPPLSLHTMRQDVPGAWEGVILRCLEKEMKDRYQTAEDVLTDLRSDRAGVAAARQQASFSLPVSTAVEEPTVIKPLTMPNNLQFMGSAQLGEVLPSDFVPTVKRKSPPPPAPKGGLGLMILGGIFVWLGMIALVLGGIATLVTTFQAPEDRIAERGALTLVVVMGAALFAIGILFEIFDPQTPNRLLFVALLLGAGFTGVLLVLGTAPNFFTAGLGALSALALSLFYFNLKEL